MQTKYQITYKSPNGEITEWHDVENFDEFKREKITENEQYKKGSWFAKQKDKGHFRF
jgi:hypothetical protein